MKPVVPAVKLTGLIGMSVFLIACQGGLTVDYADEGLGENALANPVAADTLDPEADQPKTSSKYRVEVIPPAPEDEDELPPQESIPAPPPPQ